MVYRRCWAQESGRVDEEADERRSKTPDVLEEDADVVDVDRSPRFVRKRDSIAAASMSCLLYTSPSPRDRQKSRMPSSA